MTNTRRVARVNGAAAVGIFVLLIAVSLVVKPPTPPTIAEFAPQAQQQIEEAPDEQSAESGAAVAGARQTIVIEGESGPEAPIAEQTVVTQKGVPSSLACVTWPDGSITQTFDPQSPPCIASWASEAGNGGATAPGVTPDEIRVAVVIEGSLDLQAEKYERIFTWFNTHFQLYGRRAVILPIVATARNGGSSTVDPMAQNANAENVAAVKPFAAFNNFETYDDRVFARRVAEAGVILTMSDAGLADGDELEAYAPYVWSFTSTWDTRQQHTAEMICRQLVGANASHGGPDVANAPRKFAIAIPNDATMNQQPQPDMRVLRDALASCGVDAPTFEYDDVGNSTQNTQMIIEFRNTGVTSVIFVLRGSNSAQALFQEARNLGYQPEWILSGTQSDRGMSGFPQQPVDQATHMFGAFPFNRPIPYAVQPGVIAYREAGVDLAGVEFPDWEYERLLLLFSGLQMAGPNLTTESFEAGLHGTTWPNPLVGQAPYYKGRVAFNGGRSAMNDASPWWYSPSARQHNETYGAAPGSYCFVDSGIRHEIGQWPNEDQFFEAPTC